MEVVQGQLQFLFVLLLAGAFWPSNGCCVTLEQHLLPDSSSLDYCDAGFVKMSGVHVEGSDPPPANSSSSGQPALNLVNIVVTACVLAVMQLVCGFAGHNQLKIGWINEL